MGKLRCFGRYRVAGVVAACLLASGCGPSQEAERHSPPMVLVEDDELEGALIDSVWKEIAPSIAGGPIQDREDAWIVEARWFRTDTRPESLYTFEEMEVLDQQGVIEDGTMVALVRYRFLIEAKDFADVIRRVEEKTSEPNWPPQMVYEAMAEADSNAD